MANETLYLFIEIGAGLILGIGLIVYLCKSKKANEDNSNALRMKMAAQEYFLELQPIRINIYQVVLARAIAHDDHGSVWLGQYNGRPVAVKRTNESDHQVADLFEEIRIVGHLQAPNIVDFIGVTWTTPLDLAVVNEYMDGGALRTVLDNHTIELTWPHQKIDIAIGIAEALAYLHGLHPSLIYRQLKSKKVLLTSQLVAKLPRFGFIHNTVYEQTLPGHFDDIRWSAPEVMVDDSYTDMADVYAFGALLSELDTRRLPYDDQKASMSEIAMKIVQGQLKPTFLNDCPRNILSIAHACLQLDPALRPSSAQVVEMLKQAKRELRR